MTWGIKWSRDDDATAPQRCCEAVRSAIQRQLGFLFLIGSRLLYVFSFLLTFYFYVLLCLLLRMWFVLQHVSVMPLLFSWKTN